MLGIQNYLQGDGKMNDLSTVKKPGNKIRSSRIGYRSMPIPEIRFNRQERLLRAVNSAASCLFSMEGDNFHLAITESLRILGQSIHSDRVTIWKNYIKNEDLYVSRIGSWNNQNTTDIKEDPVPEDLLMEAILPGWEEILGEQKPMNFLEKNMAEPYCSIAKDNGIRSVLIVPITSMGNYWGFLCFCSYTCERIYSYMDEKLLRSGGALIAAAIDRNKIIWDLIQERDEAEANARAKEDYLSRINREFQTSLYVIVGLADIAKNFPEKSDQSLEQIVDSSRQILAIMDEIKASF